MSIIILIFNRKCVLLLAWMVLLRVSESLSLVGTSCTYDNRLSVGIGSARVSTARNRWSMKIRHFINLTNGVEALPVLLASGIQDDQINFMRLQSSHCESNNFVGIIQELDHNLLMRLAMGDTCLVYDFGSRGTSWPDGTTGVPRAIWWGLEWVRYALNRSWGRKEPSRLFIRGYNVKAMFEKEYQMLPRNTRKKLRYYRPYLNLDESKEVRLHGVYRGTEIDGQPEEYLRILTGCNIMASSSYRDATTNKLVGSIEESLPEGMKVFYSFEYEGVGRSADYSSKSSE
mmetsp:Transcript_4963/g.7353  ORF Transcript_4963/g.7353 Transcript_4963/m.7353 type:complete len:287 (-) Transcript_4963:512-1372(-)